MAEWKTYDGVMNYFRVGNALAYKIFRIRSSIKRFWNGRHREVLLIQVDILDMSFQRWSSGFCHLIILARPHLQVFIFRPFHKILVFSTLPAPPFVKQIVPEFYFH